MVSKKFIIGSENTVNLLQSCLEEISKPSVDSTTRTVELTLFLADISTSIIPLLVQVLNHPPPKVPTDPKPKWDHVTFCWSSFARTGTADSDNSDWSLHEDIQILASALARQCSRLTLAESPDILECLFHNPHLELNELSVAQERLAEVECARLGTLVQKCVSLKELYIFTTYLEGPQVLGDHLVEVSHLQKVDVRRMWGQGLTKGRYRLANDFSNGLVGQLLSPQSRLQQLVLPGILLEDYHFLPIVEMLPTSQLQVLDVRDNSIGYKGLLAFARQLGNIKCLTEIVLARNPWEDSWLERYRKCIMALLHALFATYTIVRLEITPSTALVKECNRLKSLIRTNRVRRQTLEAADSIPAGVWPLILQWFASGDWYLEVILKRRKTDALYFVLRNSWIQTLASLRITPPSGKRLKVK